MRLLGIDFGAARTGLSLSDPLAITCSPLEVIHEKDAARLLERVRQVVAENQVDEIVVGLPRPLRGGTNLQQQAAEAFARQLTAGLGLPVHLWDERFTSKLAERSPTELTTGGRGRARGAAARGGRSGRAGTLRGEGSPPRDAVAACHLLQSYLDARAGRSASEG